jgi:hypothetical protein
VPAIPRDPWSIAALATAFLYAALTIDRGWIPHDDGTLAQAAVRVLTGELPHRDFAYMYTGGLAYWHALAFTLFGIHLLALRIFLLVAFGAFLLVFHAVARRFASPRASAATVLFAAAWGVPNYPAAMPTWYNLFLAVFAVWCLLRFLEEPRQTWLFLAGSACGLSIVIKVVGLYTLAAILIGLILVEADGQREGPGGARPTLFTGAVALALGLYVMLVFLLVRARLDPATVVHFVLPSAVVAGAASWRVSRSAGLATGAERAARLSRLVVPVLAGATVPVALFLVPYVVSGSIGDLLEGTLVLPQRLAYAAASPLPLGLSLPALVFLALAAAAGLTGGRARVAAVALLSLSLAGVLAFGGQDVVYLRVWSAMLLGPVLVTLLTVGLALRAWARGDAERGPLGATLLAAILGTFVLVQYPFAGPIYFFYVAPLIALCALAALRLASSAWRAPAAILYVFTLLFAGVWIATGRIYAMAQGRYEPRPPLERLALDRGHIRIPAEDRAEYEALVALVRELSAGTGVTFATPDAPEVYFLSGLRNPTPVLFDFFDEPEGRAERTLTTLEQAGVRVVVLNRTPQLSGPPPPDLLAALESRYPRAASVGRFVVRWR